MMISPFSFQQTLIIQNELTRKTFWCNLCILHLMQLKIDEKANRKMSTRKMLWFECRLGFNMVCMKVLLEIEIPLYPFNSKLHKIFYATWHGYSACIVCWSENETESRNKCSIMEWNGLDMIAVRHENHS